MSRIAVDLIAELKSKYNGELNFKRICADENIIPMKAKLPEAINGLYVRHDGLSFIILNEDLTKEERRDRSWHELYHHFRSVTKNQSEEKRANVFAALVRIPVIRENETIESLTEKYGVSKELAKVRLDYEQKKLSS